MWVLSVGYDYEGHDVVGAFKSRDKAVAWCEAHDRELRAEHYDYAVVNEVKVDVVDLEFHLADVVWRRHQG